MSDDRHGHLAFGRRIATIHSMGAEQTIKIRVRYSEADAMGYLHHSRYFQYFEIGRVELLRTLGASYADLERSGIFFVVVKAECRFKAPAKYDDELELTTRIERQTHVAIEHAYEVKCNGTLLATATTTIACVGRDGALRGIPPELGEPDSRKSGSTNGHE